MVFTRSLLIIFLCTALLCGIFLARKPEEFEGYLVYTAVAEMDEALAATLHVGDPMTDACGKEYAGEILKVTVEDALGEDSFGVYPIQGKKRVAITLGGYGKKGKEGRIGTLTPRVGEAVYLLGRARIEGICVRVRML